MIEYAVYKGEDLLVVGTSAECAELLGMSKETVRWHSTPTAKRRLATRKNPERCLNVVKLDDED